MRRREFLAAGIGGLCLAGSARAQAWPSRRITWIVPYPAGGGTDVVSRAIAPKVSDALGQPVIIENRSGASTITGTTAVAQAAPDGYTIGLITDSHAINAGFGRPLPYNSDTDFTPIIHLIRVPLVLIVNSNLVPMRTLPEVVKHAKENPGWLTFGSLGPGSPHEIGMLWFKTIAGLEMLIVPYRGIAPALTDVIGGHVKSMFVGVAVADELIKAGKVHPIAVTSPSRLTSAPDIPTFAEQGYPDYELVTWYGMVGPRNTPPDIVRRLNTEMNAAMKSPDVADRIQSAGGEIAGGAPEDLLEVIRRDTAKYRKIIELTGAKPE